MNGMQFNPQMQLGNMQTAIQNPYMAAVNPYMNRFTQPYNNNPSTQNNGIIWVQGIEGAKAFQMPENSNAILLDSETTGSDIRIYIKTSDNIGMCTLRIFDGTEITENQTSNIANNFDMSQYVTREELKNILQNLGGNANAEQPIPAAKSTGTAAKNK